MRGSGKTFRAVLKALELASSRSIGTWNGERIYIKGIKIESEGDVSACDRRSFACERGRV